MNYRLNSETKNFFEKLLVYVEANNLDDYIPCEIIRQGIESQNVEVNGRVFCLIHNPKIYAWIKPPLELCDYQKLHLKYLIECMRKRREDSEWIDLPYIAAHSVVMWFLHLWEDKSQNHLFLEQWREALANAYCKGDSHARECIIVGVLSKLFLNDDIRKYFKDWEYDVDLKIEFTSALKEMDPS